MKNVILGMLLACLTSGCATSYLWDSVGIRDHNITGFTHAYASSNAVFVTYGVSSVDHETVEWYRSLRISTTMETVDGKHLRPYDTVDFNGHSEPLYSGARSVMPSSITSAPPESIAIPIIVGIGDATSSVDLLGEHDAIVLADFRDPDSRFRNHLVALRSAESPTPTLLRASCPLGKGKTPSSGFSASFSTAWWRTPLAIILTPVAVVCDIACIPVFVVGGGVVIIGIGTGLLDPN
jgi:hypothetical protein